LNLLHKKRGNLSTLIIAAALTAALFFVNAAVPFSVSAADKVDNISKLDQSYTGSVVDGKYTTRWGKVFGGNFDNGKNPSAALYQNTEAAETAGKYLIDSSTVKLNSKSAIVIDANTGNILFNKNMNKKIYPASCTKVLTAIVAIENSNLDDTLTVSQHATDLAYNSSHIALQPGEKLSMEQALYGLLMCSANDCAITIAENVGGSTEKFADMMNKKAKELGCTDSHFVNPNGLYNKNHYTTAHDLAVIMNYCVKNKIFERIDTSWRYKMNKTNKSKKRDLWNGHYMIVHKYYYLYGIVGGKNGYIDESRFNLITHYQKDGQDLIIVDARTDSAGEYCRDTQKLIKLIRSSYSAVKIDSSKIDVSNVTVKNSNKHGSMHVKGKLSSVMYAEIPAGYSAGDLKYDFVSATGLKDHIGKGEVIGTETAKLNGAVVGTAVVTAAESAGYLFTVGHIVGVLGAAALIIIVLFAVLAVRTRRARKRRSRARVTGGSSRMERRRQRRRF
jgi:D-alanyl-D-alanine carboxypeptidase (penicillin-binding protein 5/6)